MDSRLFLFALLLLALLSSMSAQPHYTEIPEEDLKDDELINAAKAAIRKHNEDTGANLVFYSIESGSEATYQGAHWYQMLLKVHAAANINAGPIIHNYDVEFYVKTNHHVTIVRFQREE